MLDDRTDERPVVKLTESSDGDLEIRGERDAIAVDLLGALDAGHVTAALHQAQLIALVFDADFVDAR